MYRFALTTQTVFCGHLYHLYCIMIRFDVSYVYTVYGFETRLSVPCVLHSERGLFIMLSKIKEDVLKHAQVISNTLDVDVLIIDSDYNVVTATRRYFDSYDSIGPNTLIGSTIHNRRNVIVRSRADVESCRICGAYEKCKMDGFVGVPVYLDGDVVGAVALVMPSFRADKVFEDEDGAVRFIESMAELLAGKLKAGISIMQLETTRREREIIMDTLKDAYAFTTAGGVITYCNRKFSEVFCPDGQTAAGKYLGAVIAHPRIDELVSVQQDIKNQIIFYESHNVSFYGYLSCMQVAAGGVRSGMTFRFKALAEDGGNGKGAHDLEKGVTFNWLGRGFFPENVVHEAKRLAVTDKNILICGDEGSGGKLLAKCIHNYSNRSDRPITVIECHRIYRDNLPLSLFGIIGRLHGAQDGTVVFSDIERMPMSLQVELVDFLKRPAGRGSADMVDTRFIYLTQRNLQECTERGLFLDELYYRISENAVEIPPLREEPELLRRQIKNCIEFYKKRYGRPGFSVTDEELDRLCACPWYGNIQQVEEYCDCMVFSGSVDIALSEVLVGRPPVVALRDNNRTISDIERKMISDMLQARESKEKIAQILGISRATLYRKIKSYQL